MHPQSNLASSKGGQTPIRGAFKSGQTVNRRPTLRARALKERSPREENVEGKFYVDHTCIDCDTCRWMEPKIFDRINGMTAVVKQPADEEETLSAAQALLACPTHSIHVQPQNGEVKRAAASFPKLFPGTQNLYHLGYHAEHSFGAASYLIRRDTGNIMMDSPRFDKTLLKNIKEMGGAKYMILSHKDDVADHAQWAKELGLERIIHKDECTQRQGTTECEIKLQGTGPWQLPDKDGNIEIIHTPGHTRGHIVVLYTNPEHPEENTLLTGDHLGFVRRDEKKILSIFKRVNWYSLEEQIASLAKVKDLPFQNLLCGHGRPGNFASVEDKTKQIAEVLQQEGYSG